ncbi:uncharacterized protein LOC142985210 [Anticarsia gemmatalis]|uniref:uncharacterized protein LOC142985210 n=1 Tax=Anticarsia gemmatalis TaxID=129554 RepID=UPI003F76A9FC
MSSTIWDHYKKIKDIKKAICNYCLGSYSYATTITNLKQHLRNKHGTVIPDVIKELTPDNSLAVALNELFTEKDDDSSFSKCNLCANNKYFKSKLQHLKAHHPAEYRKFVKKRSFRTRKDSDSDTTIDNDDDEESSLTSKAKELWQYFEQEGSKARCVVCREGYIDTDYEFLRAHMIDKHPKLMLHFVHDHQETTTKSDVEEDDNLFTEVVYLEDSAPEDSRSEKRTFIRKRAPKRPRISSPEHPVTLKKEFVENTPTQTTEENELDIFMKYIKCLLKKLPADVFSKVQVDILKTIMDAQYSNRVETESVASILRVSEVDNSVIGNYTITLENKNDTEKNDK